MSQLPARFSPFGSAELDLTNWSDRLAAITWRGVSPDGDVNARTMAAFRAAMTAAGWAETVQGDLMTPLGFDAVLFEKDLPTNLGTRRMLVEARKAGDRPRTCRAFLGMMRHQHARDVREAAYWVKVNAAFQAEAVRLGVALDSVVGPLRTPKQHRHPGLDSGSSLGGAKGTSGTPDQVRGDGIRRYASA